MRKLTTCFGYCNCNDVGFYHQFLEAAAVRQSSKSA